MGLRLVRNRKGVTLIEFALVIPIFLILVAATIDFGYMFWVQHTLQFATREGARLALVGRTFLDSNGIPLTREASIIQEIREKAQVAVPPNDVLISIYPVDGSYNDPAGWEGMQDAGLPGQYMRVRTRYDFHVPLIAAFVPTASFQMKAQATYRNEQFN